MLITVEGIDGAGKSTLISRLNRWFVSSYGITPLVTKEPGGTVLGARIRDITSTVENVDPLARLLLFAADRAHHVNRVVKPALEKGNVVLCDRFTDSTVAYQHYGQGTKLALVEMLNMLSCSGIAPDLTLVVDIDPSEAAVRLSKRVGADIWDSMPLEFLRAVRDGYRAIAENEPWRVVLLNGATNEYDLLAQAQDAITNRVISNWPKHNTLAVQMGIMGGVGTFEDS